jgi:pimeloyl-ACP methyl ester carboxylesterase/DNA-binding SARP family transcriptional activator
VNPPFLLLLGPPAVRIGANVAPLVLRPKAVALLTYLALAKRDVARSELARLLFAEAEAPLAALRWHLAHIRAHAPSFIARALRATRDRVELPIRTDVALFAARAEALGRRRTAPARRATLALYRGDLLVGLTVSASADFDNWLYVEQEGLRRLFRQAVLSSARRQSRTAAQARATTTSLARLVSVDPYCEEAHVLLIRAYERAGDLQAARASYDRYEQIVRHELAAEPRASLVKRFERRQTTGRRLPLEALVPLTDVTLHIVEWPGAEPPILAVHGSAGIAHMFGTLAEGLAPSHRVIAVDLRGHGFSDKPPSGYDLERHVADLLELMQVLRLRRPVVMGHSAGGAIATFLAARADVAGLVLLEGVVGDRAFAENAAARAAPIIAGLDKRYASLDAYLTEWRARRGRFTDEAERLADRWARFALTPLPDGRYRERGLRAAVEAEWRSIVDADGLAALGRVAAPVLIVHALKPWLGGRPYFTREIVEVQLNTARAATLYVARDSDHGTLLRDPEPSMVDAILAFIGGRASSRHEHATARYPGTVRYRPPSRYQQRGNH